MTPEEAQKALQDQGFTGLDTRDPQQPTPIDPNQQAGVDQFGNPINRHGLPLGQSPPPPPGPNDGYTPPRQGTPGGNLFYDYGQNLAGANTYRPQTGAPSISSPGMQAAQMQNAGMNTQQADQDRQLGLTARSEQVGLSNAIMQRALGRGGPSVAELQMQRGVGMAQQAAARQAASARGIGRGLAAYGAQNAQANLAAQGVQDAAALRAQEQIAAQGLAQKGLSDMRMQDLTSRGMSIQQAQAIMDAENRAREANMGATNRARETSLNANMQAQQANLQADTALRGMTAQITEGEAARKQKGAGVIPAVVGTGFDFSDVRAKMDVQPLYSTPFAAPATEQGPTLEERSRQMQQERQMSVLQAQAAPQAAPIEYDQPAPMAASDENPFAALVPPPQQKQEKKSGLLAGLLSDKRAKEDAFKAGVAAASGGVPVLQKAKVSSAPAFDTSPDRVRRVGRREFFNATDERDKKVDLAKAFKFLSDMKKLAPQIRADGEQQAAAVAPLAPTATSDKRAKSYSYSDKETKQENASLKEALAKMGNAAAAQIRGESAPRANLSAALGRLGRDADVSSVPTAAYPDVEAEQAREANPPPGYQYSYKPEFAAKQGTDADPRLGFMAQDALKSPMYRPAVVEMPDGMLGIDQNRLLHANTAMLSGEHKRLDEAEERDRLLAQALTRLGNKRSSEIRGIR